MGIILSYTRTLIGYLPAGYTGHGYPLPSLKTAFITPYGVFCYQVMPFGLKNAGATYQRMMQNCLGSQIGRNIQVYIDDVVITTRKEESLINDLAETFDNLNRYKLKLNLIKCSFGVSAG
jgi:hypothetical protein